MNEDLTDAETGSEPRGSTDETTALREFKTKLVKARDAYACCKKGYLRTSLFALQVMDFITEQFNAPPSGPMQATVVLPKVQPWVRVTVSRPMPGVQQQVGFVDYLTGEAIATFGGPETQEQLQAMARAVLTITEVSRRTTSDCVTCIRKALLSQRKKRQSVQLKEVLGSDKRILARIPHR